MKTAKVFRGVPGQTFWIYEENSSGRATFGWKPGESYLLFLYYFSKQDGGWLLDGCGNSGPLSRAAVALKQVETIPGTRGGMIQAAIGGNSFTYSIQGAHVQARNSTGAFFAITNKHGVAEIHVPSGEYRVVVLSGEKVRPFELSYEDPQKIVIEDGGCAQIQFVAKQ